MDSDRRLDIIILGSDEWIAISQNSIPVILNIPLTAAMLGISNWQDTSQIFGSIQKKVEELREKELKQTLLRNLNEELIIASKPDIIEKYRLIFNDSRYKELVELCRELSLIDLYKRSVELSTLESYNVALYLPDRVLLSRLILKKKIKKEQANCIIKDYVYGVLFGILKGLRNVDLEDLCLSWKRNLILYIRELGSGKSTITILKSISGELFDFSKKYRGLYYITSRGDAPLCYEGTPLPATLAARTPTPDGKGLASYHTMAIIIDKYNKRIIILDPTRVLKYPFLHDSEKYEKHIMKSLDYGGEIIRERIGNLERFLKETESLNLFTRIYEEYTFRSLNSIYSNRNRKKFKLFFLF